MTAGRYGQFENHKTTSRSLKYSPTAGEMAYYPFVVIPAKAGILTFQGLLDSGSSLRCGRNYGFCSQRAWFSSLLDTECAPEERDCVVT